MTARMYNDEKYRIIPTLIHPGGSIVTHTQTSGDDMNYILSGKGKIDIIADYIANATENNYNEQIVSKQF